MCVIVSQVIARPPPTHPWKHPAWKRTRVTRAVYSGDDERGVRERVRLGGTLHTQETNQPLINIPEGPMKRIHSEMKWLNDMTKIHNF